MLVLRSTFLKCKEDALISFLFMKHNNGLSMADSRCFGERGILLLFGYVRCVANDVRKKIKKNPGMLLLIENFQVSVSVSFGVKSMSLIFRMSFSGKTTEKHAMYAITELSEVVPKISSQSTSRIG